MSKVIVDEIQTDTTNGNVRVIPNGTGALEVKGDGSSNDAKLQLNCYANTHGVKIKSPAHTHSQEYTMILPDNNIAADKVLKVKSIVSGSGTSAVGQLEFADASGGITVQEEGSALSTAATTLNFVGSSVTASGTGATKTITISGGGGGVTSDAQFNTVAGTNAGSSFSGTSPEDNTLFGYNAGTAITTGDGNVCVGSSSGLKLTGGVHNVLIGVSAGQEGVTNVSYNVAIGNKALYNMSDGCNHNIAIGQEVAQSASGNANVFIGRKAAYAITTGYSNVAIGYESLYAATDDFQNVAIGYQALYQTESNQNNAVGYQSLYGNTTGYYNDAFGTYAGYAITTGNHNVCLGYQAGNSSSPSGAIGTGSNNVVLGNNNINNLYCADTTISSSDQRDKTDITSFNLGLAWVEALRPVTYRWDRRTWYGTDDEPYGTPDGSKKRNKLNLGFLAQEALEVEKANGYGTSNDDSITVHLNEDGMSYGMKYERLVPILVNAIKELSTRVKTLEGG